MQAHPTVRRDAIERAVAEAYSPYDASLIRDFLPVLVERLVNQDLPAIGDRGHALTGWPSRPRSVDLR